MAKKLLLADDSQTIQKVVDLVLGPEGFDISAYGNGDDARDALQTLMFDIIIADIEMPGLNGYQLCEKIRADARTQNIPLILLAGAFEPFDEDRMKSIGADDYILKPFESHELISKVKALLIHHEDAEAVVAEEALAGKNEWIESYHFPADAASGIIADDFEKELKESIKMLEEDIRPEEPSEPEAMTIEEISKMVKEAVGVPLDFAEEKQPAPALIRPEAAWIDEGAVEAIVRDSVRDITEALKLKIEETVCRQISELLPRIFEESAAKALGEMSGNMQDMINTEIKKVVPDLAERIIRREIEKITSGLA
jgi:DNA-binding response OmpR family regulator